MMEAQGSTLSAFRAHRHDVLNALQLIRAYIQMNRPNDAIRAVDGLAGWLQSIGNLQSQLGDEQENVLWLFIRCPHVHISRMARFPILEEAAFRELSVLWHWLEMECTNQGAKQFDVEFLPRTDAVSNTLDVGLRVTEEIHVWWETIQDINNGQHGFGQWVTLTRI